MNEFKGFIFSMGFALTACGLISMFIPEFLPGMLFGVGLGMLIDFIYLWKKDRED